MGISPVASAPTLMDWPTAQYSLIARQSITKLEWKDRNLYSRLRNGLLMIHLEDGWHTWTVSESDMNDRDWVLLE